MHAHPFAGAVVDERAFHRVAAVKFDRVRVEHHAVDVGHGVDDGNLVAVRVGIGAEREDAEPEGHGVKQGLLRGEAVGIVREEVVDFLVDVLFAGVPRERVRGVGVRDRVRLVRDDVNRYAVARYADELVIVLAPLLAR